MIATARRRQGDPNAHAGRSGRAGGREGGRERRGEGRRAEAQLQPTFAPPFADFDIKKQVGGRSVTIHIHAVASQAGLEVGACESQSYISPSASSLTSDHPCGHGDGQATQHHPLLASLPPSLPPSLHPSIRPLCNDEAGQGEVNGRTARQRPLGEKTSRSPQPTYRASDRRRERNADHFEAR